MLPPVPNPEIEALERLSDEIAVLSAEIEVATARLLDMIRDFDARGGWANGFKTCADWLSWRVGMDRGAAHQRVRVARALPELPRISQAFACGELSYSKVRALTRVATPETEERLLKFARCGTAVHVERLVRGWRRVDRNAENQEAAQRHKSRALYVYQDEDGMFVIRGRLTPEVGALVRQAIAAACDRMHANAPVNPAEGLAPSGPQRSLDATSPESTSGPRRRVIGYTARGRWTPPKASHRASFSAMPRGRRPRFRGTQHVAIATPPATETAYRVRVREPEVAEVNGAERARRGT